MDDFSEIEVVGGDHEVGGFLVEGAALGKEAGDGFALVICVEEWAFCVTRDPVEDRVFGGVKPDGESDFPEKSAIFWSEHDPATGSDDLGRLLDETGEST